MSKTDTPSEETKLKTLSGEDLEESWDQVLASLKDSADKNQTPFSDFTEEDWGQLRKAILAVSTSVEERRKGDRRGVCPFEGMSDEEWNEIWITMKKLKLGGPNRRKEKRRD